MKVVLEKVFPLDASAEPGGYLAIHRTWKNGDRIEMTLPMRLSVEAMPDDATTQAFLYGPLVLAGDLGNEGLTDELIIGANAPAFDRRRPNAVMAAEPSVQTSAGPIGLQVSQAIEIDRVGPVVSMRPLPPAPRRPMAPALEIPTFQAAGDDPASWIRPDEKPLTFHTTGQKRDVTLAPIHTLFDKRYAVYWKVS